MTPTVYTTIDIPFIPEYTAYDVICLVARCGARDVCMDGPQIVHVAGFCV